MPVEIDDSDEISRCIIYDRAFDQDIHVDEKLWIFGRADSDNLSHESAVLRRFAPQADDVHQIGCNIAEHQNERNDQPERGPKRRYYCGFRTAPFASLPKGGEGFEILIRHDPEDGVKAHVDVALRVTVEGKNARAGCRTEAGLALAEQFGPPAGHQCECDNDDDHHPIALWGLCCLTGGLSGRWHGIMVDDSVDEYQGQFLAGE